MERWSKEEKQRMIYNGIWIEGMPEEWKPSADLRAMRREHDILEWMFFRPGGKLTIVNGWND